jgi:hypothetical protein
MLDFLLFWCLDRNMSEYDHIGCVIILANRYQGIMWCSQLLTSAYIREDCSEQTRY